MMGRSSEPKTDHTPASEMWAAGAGYATGDHVVIRRNDPQLGVCNGDRAVITTVDLTRRRLTVEIGDRHIDLDLRSPRGQPDRPALQHG